MNSSRLYHFLYDTPCGRAMLKMLVMPWVSDVTGAYLNSALSKPLIGFFIKKTGVTLEGIDVPEKGFKSFNDFFTRKRTEIDFDTVPEHLCSPCDGYFSCVEIAEDSRFNIKHTSYSLSELLGDETLAKELQGGVAMIFRLAPSTYHRYCFVDGGEVLYSRKIKGVLHCVCPIAAEKFPVYVQNSREYVLFRSENFGDFVQMEVGAMLVGRISNNSTAKAKRGDEKGFFEFGGSTIILLLKKGTVNALPSAEERFVRQGEWVASKPRDAAVIGG